MIQIQNITVKNFKNIESADLDLNPINVIIGPNGSGKSNFLTVLSFLKVVLRGSNDVVENLFNHGYDLKLGTLLPDQLHQNRNCSISLSLKDSEGMIFNYLLEIDQEVKGAPLKIVHEEFSFKKKNQQVFLPLFSRERGKVFCFTPESENLCQTFYLKTISVRSSP